jgi:hypothetical protein
MPRTALPIADASPSLASVLPALACGRRIRRKKLTNMARSLVREERVE